MGRSTKPAGFVAIAATIFEKGHYSSYFGVLEDERVPRLRNADFFDHADCRLRSHAPWIYENSPLWVFGQLREEEKTCMHPGMLVSTEERTNQEGAGGK